MLWNTFDTDRPIYEKLYEETAWVQDSGLAPDALRQECARLEETLSAQGRMTVKSSQIALILEQGQIAVHERDWFPDRLNHGDIMTEFRVLWQRQVYAQEMAAHREENFNAQKSFLFRADVDYGHTVPDMKALLHLGFAGLLRRSEEAAARPGLTEKQNDFYRGVCRVYRALLAFTERLAAEAEKKGTPRMELVARSLRNLTVRAPETLLEAMQQIFLYYLAQQHMDGAPVRSLGGLDSLLYPYYQEDLAAGRLTEEQARELLDCFLMKLCAKKATANMPFYLGATDVTGAYQCNPMTYMILEEYIRLDIYDPKIHIRYDKSMPEDLLLMVLDSIRSGKNSFLIMQDTVVVDALMSLGQSREEAVDYAPVGCYEPASQGRELPCSCAGKVNIVKSLEAVLFRGRDLRTDVVISRDFGEQFPTFESFYTAVRQQLAEVMNKTSAMLCAYERYYPKVMPSPVYSGNLADCVERGRDAYDGGARYNNTSINAFGIATAVDSLLAIKELVYEKKTVTLDTLREALRQNWDGYEPLRQQCLNCSKYGCGDPKADAFAAELCSYLAGLVNNKPNGRGGVFRFGMFSIDWNFDHGARTGATPDGRFSEMPVSRNYSAVTAMDRRGVTGLIRSAAAIAQKEIPNGAVLDLMLHPSAVHGESGLQAMLGLVRTYMHLGGMAVHINVLDAGVLRAAQEHPEEHATLQVRVCGWNAYFNDLSRAEQDEFIRKAEHSEG